MKILTFAPPDLRRPNRNMTARSYSWTTYKTVSCWWSEKSNLDAQDKREREGDNDEKDGDERQKDAAESWSVMRSYRKIIN